MKKPYVWFMAFHDPLNITPVPLSTITVAQKQKIVKQILVCACQDYSGYFDQIEKR